MDRILGWKSTLVNSITLGNLVCGCLSIIQSFGQQYGSALAWIGLGLVFDFMDGLIARLLKAESATGVQLDSLADLINFGLAPTFLLFQLIHDHENTLGVTGSVWPYVSLVLVVFSAVRLARFNIGLQQTSSGFIGLPTPAAAMTICSLPMSKLTNPEAFSSMMSHPGLIGVFVLSTSVLMIAPIEFMNLKFKSFDYPSNRGRYSFLGMGAVGAVLLFIFSAPYLIIPFVVVLYIIFSNLSIRTKTTL